MTGIDINARLNNISKEQLLANFTQQLQQMQNQEASLHSEIAARDNTIRQLQQQIASMQAQATLDKSVSDRLIQSSRQESQNIINDANAKAQSMLQQAQNTVNQANTQASQIIQQANTQAEQMIDEKTRLVKSQIAALQGQKEQMTNEMVRYLQGIMDSCDTFSANATDYSQGIASLRKDAAAVLESVKTEQYVQSTIGTPSEITIPARNNKNANTGSTDFSALESLLTPNNNDDYDDTMKTTRLNQTSASQPSYQAQSYDNSPDNNDDYHFDPNDVLSSDEAKSLTGEFGINLDDDDNQDENSDDADYDDYNVSGDEQQDIVVPQRQRRPRHKQNTGQWFAD